MLRGRPFGVTTFLGSVVFQSYKCQIDVSEVNLCGVEDAAIQLRERNPSPWRQFLLQKGAMDSDQRGCTYGDPIRTLALLREDLQSSEQRIVW